LLSTKQAHTIILPCS